MDWANRGFSNKNGMRVTKVQKHCQVCPCPPIVPIGIQVAKLFLCVFRPTFFPMALSDFCPTALSDFCPTVLSDVFSDVLSDVLSDGVSRRFCPTFCPTVLSDVSSDGFVRRFCSFLPSKDARVCF